MLRIRVPSIAVVSGGGITGNASVTFPTFTCSGDGSLAIQGNSAVTFPTFTATATAALAIQGNASVTFPAITGSGTGALAIQGDASVAFPTFTCSGTGVSGNAITGDASVTFPVITSDPLVYPVVGTDSATKRFDVDGNYVSRFGTSSKFTITGSSTGNDGTYTVASVSYLVGSDKTRIIVQETVPANGGGGTLTQINGALSIQGNASVTFPTFTANATATLAITGNASVTFSAITGSGTGILSGGITGDANVLFPAITGSGTGSLLIQGNANVTFPNVTSTSGEIPTVSVGGGTSIPKKTKKRVAKNSEVLRWSKEKDTFKPDALEKVLLNQLQPADQIIEETVEVQSPKVRKASQKRIDALNAEKAQKALDLENQRQIAKEERLLLESIAKEDAEIIDMYLKMEQKETMALLDAMRVILSA